MPVRPPKEHEPETALAVEGRDANEGLFGIDVPEDDDEEMELMDAEETPAAAQSSEAHVAKVKPIPTRPNSEEVAAHDATHCPFRSWCPICVEASSKEDPHPRSSGRDAETGLPIISLDYDLIEDKITVLIVKDKESSACLAYECTTKGPDDEWVVRQLVKDLESWGRTDIVLKTDGEPAMLALQSAIIKARSHRTVLRNSPAYNPQSNGSAEKGVQDVTDLIRRHVLALQARLKQKVNLKIPVLAWLIRHAAFVITRYSVGHDGLTPWRRLTGKGWNGVIAEFGEQVMAKLALKKPPTDKKAKKNKKKLASRSIPGTWLGIYERTGEHLVATRRGEVIRVRTIHRLPKADQWNPEAVLAVAALPRKPNPESGRMSQNHSWCRRTQRRRWR